MSHGDCSVHRNQQETFLVIITILVPPYDFTSIVNSSSHLKVPVRLWRNQFFELMKTVRCTPPKPFVDVAVRAMEPTTTSHIHGSREDSLVHSHLNLVKSAVFVQPGTLIRKRLNQHSSIIVACNSGTKTTRWGDVLKALFPVGKE